MKSTPQLNKLQWTGVFVALIGFLDAAYLTIKYYVGGTIPCGILDGCDTVTTSIYSEIAGIPVALLGSLYYLAMMVLFAISLETKNQKVLKAACFLSIAAFIASLGFVYIQIFILQALCLYCMISALTSTILFALSMYMLRLMKHDESESNPVASI